MKTPTPRKPNPIDVTNDRWAFVTTYLRCPQRRHALRDVFNVLRWIVRAGSPRRLLPNDLPPRAAVRQQTQRWIAVGCFEVMVYDLRALMRVAQGREPDSRAVTLDGGTPRSTPESGHRAGYDGHERTKGGKIHYLADTVRHLLAVRVTPANAQERAQVVALAAADQEATGDTVKLAYVDQEYTGAAPVLDAAEHGIRLEVVKLADAKRGFVSLPRR